MDTLNEQKPVYETAMKRLEIITERMEKEELSLSEQMALFEEGMKLAEQCQAELSQFEEKLRQWTETGDEAPLDGR